MQDPQSIQRVIEDLDHSAEFQSLRPEDPEVTVRLVRPLEELLQPVSQLPELPDSSAGRMATSVWTRLHARTAELQPMLRCVMDSAPVVRFAALEALKVSLDIGNSQWREPGFSLWARKTLQGCRMKEDSRIVTYLLKELIESAAKRARQSTRPHSSIRKNPYVAGMPVRDSARFFGRQDVLAKIGDTLGQLPGVKSFILYGARRSGKTSILLQIKAGTLGSSFLPVYMDMQGFAGVDANMFLASLARAIINETGAQVDPSLPSTNSREFRLAVQTMIQAALKSLTRNVVVLIDEYEILLDYIRLDPTLTLQIQYLVEHLSNLFFVFAGSHTLESAATSSSIPLLDAARYVKITFLSHQEALELVLAPAKGIVSYDTGVADKLVTLTAGHPFYTQLLCQSLFDTALDANYVVTETMLDDAVAKFVRDPAPHVILTWNGLSLEQKVAASTLAAVSSENHDAGPYDIIVLLESESYPSLPSATEVRKALTNLCEAGWVEECPPQGRYRFTMELVRKWIVANRSITVLADEQRSRLLQSVASPWRQWAAELVDTVGAGVWTGLVAGSAMIAVGSVTAIYAGLAAALLYFVCPMMVGQFTIGLRMFKLHPSDRHTVVLRKLKTAGYGVLLLVRVAVVYATILGIASAILDHDHAVLGVSITVIACTVLILDHVLMRISVSRQGIYERLLGVVLVFRS